ncbi:MAG: peptide chain release factor 2 [Parcubacteria group bacterium]
MSDIELAMQASDFWKDHIKSGEISKELNSLKEELGVWEGFEEKLDGYLQMSDDDLVKIEDALTDFEKNFKKQYIKVFLSGKYDKNDAIMHIHAGAGGVDAADWAGMLLEMYQKYCEDHGYEFTVLHKALGEQKGIKNATGEIKGKYAFGYLKKESGVHRLVRISPFSAKSLRHTSFAMVELLPKIEYTKMNIDSDDLKIDTFKSSGPGGQNVNKLETAVRITHTPTNTVASVQSERSQAQNKEKAMMLLSSKLAKLLEEHRVKEVSELRGKLKDQQIEWGSQIRSYVLHPYQMVKDHRTNTEVSNIEGVLQGELDEFIEAELTAND